MYEKNGKVYLDENEYLRESPEIERNIRERRHNTLSCFIVAVLLMLMILIPAAMWLRDFRAHHPPHPEESKTAMGVTTCISN